MELQDHVEAFAAAGVRVVAVSPEPVEVIARFTERYGVTFPVLSDAGSAVINEYGILNTEVPEDHRLRGMPFPGAYLTDIEGRIAQKHFNTNYRVRESAEVVIRGDLGEWYDPGSYPSATGGSVVSASLGSRELKPFSRIDLLVRIDLPDGQHAYGEPVSEGLVATSVTVTGPEELRAEAPVMPSTRPLFVEGVGEELQVFEGDIHIRVPLSYRNAEAPDGGGTVPIGIEVRYQACDELVCFLPVEERLTLDAPLGGHLRPERD